MSQEHQRPRPKEPYRDNGSTANPTNPDHPDRHAARHLAHLATVPDGDEIAILVRRMQTVSDQYRADTLPSAPTSFRGPELPELDVFLGVLRNTAMTKHGRLVAFMDNLQTENGIAEFLFLLEHAMSSHLEDFLVQLEQHHGYPSFVQQLQVFNAWPYFTKMLQNHGYEPSMDRNPCAALAELQACASSQNLPRMSDAATARAELCTAGRSLMMGEHTPPTPGSVTAVRFSRAASGIHTPSAFASPRIVQSANIDLRTPNRSPILNVRSPRSNRAASGSKAASGLATPRPSTMLRQGAVDGLDIQLGSENVLVTPPSEARIDSLTLRTTAAQHGSHAASCARTPQVIEWVSSACDLISPGRSPLGSRAASPTNTVAAAHGSRAMSGVHTPALRTEVFSVSTDLSLSREPGLLTPGRSLHNSHSASPRSACATHGSRAASAALTPVLPAPRDIDWGPAARAPQVENGSAYAVHGSRAASNLETPRSTDVGSGMIRYFGVGTAGMETPPFADSYEMDGPASPGSNVAMHGSRAASGTHTPVQPLIITLSPYVIPPGSMCTRVDAPSVCAVHGSLAASTVQTPSWSVGTRTPRGEDLRAPDSSPLQSGTGFFVNHAATIGFYPAFGARGMYMRPGPVHDASVEDLITPGRTPLGDRAYSPGSAVAMCGSRPASGTHTPATRDSATRASSTAQYQPDGHEVELRTPGRSPIGHRTSSPALSDAAAHGSLAASRLNTPRDSAAPARMAADNDLITPGRSPLGSRARSLRSHRATLGSRPASGIHTPSSTNNAATMHDTYIEALLSHDQPLPPLSISGSNVAMQGSMSVSGIFTPGAVTPTDENGLFDAPFELNDVTSPCSIYAVNASRAASGIYTPDACFPQADELSGALSATSHDAMQNSRAPSGIASPSERAGISRSHSITSHDAMCNSRPQSGLASLDGRAHDELYGPPPIPTNISGVSPSVSTGAMLRATSVPHVAKGRADKEGLDRRLGANLRSMMGVTTKDNVFSKHEDMRSNLRDARPAARRSRSVPPGYLAAALSNPRGVARESGFSGPASMESSSRWFSFQSRNSGNQLQRRLAEDLGIQLS
eukprot:GEMP01001072.1.p1 GENE.GEMP01001072.1~~GEMP01001072.1.p1  ORF type:complete len:1086 (+),score=192.63 GEMP01001072.1:789-4046(+)